MKDYCMVIMPTHNSAAKTQGELFSTCLGATYTSTCTYKHLHNDPEENLTYCGRTTLNGKTITYRTIKLSKIDTKQLLNDSTDLGTHYIQ